MIAPSSPAQCFEAIFEAARIAITLPHAGDLPQRPLRRQLVGAVEHPGRARRCRRSTRTSAPSPPASSRSCPTRATTAWRGRGRSRARRAWRTASAAWRSRTARAAISYDGENHQRMTDLRAAKVAGVDVPDLEVVRRRGRRPARDRLGLELRRRSAPACAARARAASASPSRTSTTSTRCPPNTGEVLRAYERVLLPEMNTRPARQGAARRVTSSTSSRYSKVKGQPLFAAELEQEILKRVDESPASTHATANDATRRRTSSPTRRRAGARAAATTRSSPPSRASSRSSGSRRRRSSSSPASAAPGASRTTWTRTGCTASTAAAPRWRPAWRPRATTCRSGS